MYLQTFIRIFLQNTDRLIKNAPKLLDQRVLSQFLNRYINHNLYTSKIIDFKELLNKIYNFIYSIRN